MMRHLTLAILLLAISTQSLIAQVNTNLTNNSSDYIGEAEALILLDSGITEVSEDFGLISYQIQRTKILNKKGLKYSAIEFPFNEDDTLVFIQAVHYKPTADKKLITKEYGKDKKYDFIFNERIMLFRNDKYDITEDVLGELNARYKK